jgi:hypothetical protein
MKPGPLLFRITGIVIFLQLALGGLLTFDFIPVAPHILVGLLALILSVVTTLLSWLSKPSFRPMRIAATGLVAMVLIQIGIGFTMLKADSDLLSWIHLMVALGIYGVAVAGTFTSVPPIASTFPS